MAKLNRYLSILYKDLVESLEYVKKLDIDVTSYKGSNTNLNNIVKIYNSIPKPIFTFNKNPISLKTIDSYIDPLKVHVSKCLLGLRITLCSRILEQFKGSLFVLLYSITP